ncbi:MULTISPECIES: dephospho-CoA kinase [unclassified Enterococcus]|uniref:dephospho-CoA kinase n=1 Tax=unclassified Enterococcus TaxID=2608891 RepID=UPI00155180D9|nr:MULTISPECIES: dephospho-CoA kinase [unclassified Enterococcus]MBS7577571.1 dephospho-CoA kinase [Enterococcus sp. MMGLQ5-2]MBS7584930.1 dephospho-CoA kinase [Enterococcus sp. MMGLQ5-1]NPD12785.1 dephospho-CoA kinase [Enterococcus sp. MMGLQ5-1]NPD37404.1 dephospho-CoA kinase [Enterococcus sp. MMGLQ5-2]
MVYCVGLTGGIATGKSTVAQIIAEYYPVIDADQIVFEMQQKGGQALELIVGQWGTGVLTEAGALDRTELGSIIFSDAAERKKLDELLDPLIRSEISNQIAKHQSEDLVFVDIPLLYEQSYQDLFKEIWVVYLPESIQLERLMRRDHLADFKAKQRIASQLPIEVKATLADVVIDNSKSLTETRSAVMAELERLEAY